MFLVSYSINFQSFNNVEEYGKLQMNMLFLNSGKKVSDYNDIDSFVKDYYSIVTKSIPSFAVSANGFSQITCLPAAINSLTCG